MKYRVGNIYFKKGDIVPVSMIVLGGAGTAAWNYGQIASSADHLTFQHYVLGEDWEIDSVKLFYSGGVTRNPMRLEYDYYCGQLGQSSSQHSAVNQSISLGTVTSAIMAEFDFTTILNFLASGDCLTLKLRYDDTVGEETNIYAQCVYVKYKYR